MVSPSLFLKLFSPPKYLEQPAAGLDISDRSIKFCQLILGPQGLVVDKFGEQDLPVGAIEGGRIKQAEAVEKVLRSIKDKFGLQTVHVSLPEELAYIVKLDLPPMRRSELRESIELQLEEYVPLPASSVIFDYEIIHQPLGGKSNYTVAVSVFPADLVAEYQTLIEKAGLTIASFEVEAQAMARAIVPQGDRDIQMMVDVGKTRTGFFIVESGVVTYASTVANISGEDLTHSIQKNLNVSYAAAEKLKQSQGMLYTASDNKLLVALVPLAAALRDEVNKLFSYWKEPITQITLCGGQSSLPGLAEYLSMSLPTKIVLANVWSNISSLAEATPPIIFDQALGYSTALGLALKHWNHFSSHL